MSLINQMLRDLDARRGPAGHAQLNALHGIGPVTAHPALPHRGLRRVGWALVAGLLLSGFAFWPQAVQKHNGSADVPVATVAQWTPLPVPAPVPRTGVTLRRGADTPAPSGPRDAADVKPVREPKQATTSVELPPAAARPEPRTVAAKVAEKAPPVVESAALEPAPAEPLQAVRKPGPEQQAQQQFARAQRALAAQDWPAAQGLLRRTLESLPGHQDARTQLAALLVARGATDEAEQILAEGLAIDPQAGALAKPYAQLLAARGALQPALDVLAGVRADAETSALSAAVLHRAGDHAGAAAAYEQALHEQPEQAVWWTGLAIAREYNEQPSKALQAYRRAARLQLDGPVRQYVEQRMQALQTREGG